MLFLSFILHNNSVEKDMNIQQALFFSFLKKTKPINQKKNHKHYLSNNGANKNEAINILGFKPISISL